MYTIVRAPATAFSFCTLPNTRTHKHQPDENRLQRIFRKPTDTATFQNILVALNDAMRVSRLAPGLESGLSDQNVPGEHLALAPLCYP